MSTRARGSEAPLAFHSVVLASFALLTGVLGRALLPGVGLFILTLCTDEHVTTCIGLMYLTSTLGATAIVGAPCAVVILLFHLAPQRRQHLKRGMSGLALVATAHLVAAFVQAFTVGFVPEPGALRTVWEYMTTELSVLVVAVWLSRLWLGRRTATPQLR